MAFSGDGSVLQPGRWHLRGTRCVYASSTLSLASLEIMVHVGGGRPPGNFVFFRVGLPDQVMVEQVPDALLRPDWRSSPGPLQLAEFGSNWVEEQRTAVLRVPSAVIPDEFNYIFNPLHPQFEMLVIADPLPFEFDMRLLPG